MTISAKVIKDSISEAGNRITTMEIEYPRFILAELNTHRMLSKNSASSRAIPVKTILGQIRNDPAMPVWWGKNQPGMSAKEELVGIDKEYAQHRWQAAGKIAANESEDLMELGLHKQITNRITEPWQTMKTVITGTEWTNLFWLRDHEDAQPEFAALARQMVLAFTASKPILRKEGEWHLPYVDDAYTDIETSLKISASCCAQVSYRKLDDSVDKALDIYEKLVGMERKHASPFEHQAKVMSNSITKNNWLKWEDGVTHLDKHGLLWSGNFKGWIQHRQLIEGHVKW